MNKSPSKMIEVVAGPNGSGKTTFARAYLSDVKDTSTYLNPDVIATGMSPHRAEGVSIQAGRILLTEIKLD